MGAPSGYQYYIDIDFSTVADLTDTIFFIDLSDMPADFWNHIEKNDGSDVYVTDVNDVKLDREIVEFDDVANEGNLWIRHDASSGGTTIRIYYGNASGSETNQSTTWTSAGRTLCYHYYEGSGTTVNDSANSNTGTGIGWVANKFVSGVCRGTELQFSGSDALRASNDSTIDFDEEDFSVSMWMKGNNSGTIEVLLHKSDSAANASDAGYTLFMRNSNPYLVFGISNGSAELRNSGTTADPRDNSYHFITGTYTQSSRTVKVYLDDALEDSATNGGYSATTSNTDGLHIGEDYNRGSPTNRYAGRHDEVRIYDYDLTLNEIDHLYENQKCGSYYTVGSEEKVRIKDFACWFPHFA